MRFAEFSGLPTITDITVCSGAEEWVRLDEGKWLSGAFQNSIRIDQPTHFQAGGAPHAHAYGRNGQEYVAVNFDGTASHGSQGRLHKKDAVALQAQGFNIRSDRIVEWWIVEEWSFLLNEGSQ